MSDETAKASRRGRVLLLVAGVLIGLVLISPAGAHVGGTVGHLWKDHIRPKADNRYPHAIEVVNSGAVSIGAGDVEEAIATCPEGKVVLGGGYGSVGFDETILVARSAPTPAGTGWRMVADNPGSGSGTIIAYAVCAAVG